MPGLHHIVNLCLVCEYLDSTSKLGIEMVDDYIK